MKPDDLLDAIGNVDDALIATAQECPRRKHLSKLWIPLASVAACVLLFIVLPVVFISLRGAGSEDYAEPPKTGQSPGNVRVQIYYLKDNEIATSEQLLLPSVEEIFAAWLALNGIDEEVRLIRISYADGVTTFTVTEELVTYYDTMDASLLLESLQTTLQHAFPSEYEDCRFAYE